MQLSKDRGFNRSHAERRARWERFANAEGTWNGWQRFGLPHPHTRVARFPEHGPPPRCRCGQALRQRRCWRLSIFLPPGVRHRAAWPSRVWNCPARIRPPSIWWSGRWRALAAIDRGVLCDTHPRQTSREWVLLPDGQNGASAYEPAGQNRPQLCAFSPADAWKPGRRDAAWRLGLAITTTRPWASVATSSRMACSSVPILLRTASLL